MRTAFNVDDVRLVDLDTAATTIDLTDTAAVQVARGSVVQDADGSRRATLMFKAGTVAEIVLPNQTVDTLTSITVRATEYTVGDDGGEAMPAELPPTSAYTYAVEFSVDEAQSVGAKEVRFSQPVVAYVENFLDVPAGTNVPAAFYSFEAAPRCFMWVAV